MSGQKDASQNDLDFKKISRAGRTEIEFGNEYDSASNRGDDSTSMVVGNVQTFGHSRHQAHSEKLLFR